MSLSAFVFFSHMLHARSNTVRVTHLCNSTLLCWLFARGEPYTLYALSCRFVVLRYKTEISARVGSVVLVAWTIPLKPARELLGRCSRRASKERPRNVSLILLSDLPPPPSQIDPAPTITNNASKVHLHDGPRKIARVRKRKARRAARRSHLTSIGLRRRMLLGNREVHQKGLSEELPRFHQDRVGRLYGAGNGRSPVQESHLSTGVYRRQWPH
jgi:hypothetical protein